MIRRRSANCKLAAGLVTKTSDDVIIDETRCLHVCIDDGAADEFEAALLEVFAQRI